MGLRFDLKSANWLACLLQPGARLPRLDQERQEEETLRYFLRNLRDNFFSSPRFERRFHDCVDSANRTLMRMEMEFAGRGGPPPTEQLLEDLRILFSNRRWTALILPSGNNHELDRFLCSKEFLRDLVDVRPEDPGLILQLEDPPRELISLTDVFPAFRTVLANSTRWPGILLWTLAGDSVFLPLGSQRSELCRRSHWVFSHLATGLGIDLELLESQYYSEFAALRVHKPSKLHVVQLSDIHIGSMEASRRLPRVQQLIRNVLYELGDNARVALVITGDLMDNPDERNLDSTRAFCDFLSNLGTEMPVVVLGNHDVRKDGFLAEDLRMAMRLPTPAGRVVWYDDCRVGLACFNSAVKGHLARGFIGEQQILDIGSEIDRKDHWNEYAILGVVHHHPIPVQTPDWYMKPLYARILGSRFEPTVALEDADSMIEFVDERNFAALLHGHKHIPRIDFAGEKRIPVIGCGSTVGKVATVDESVYMSINVITCDTESGQLCGRLLAERIPGGGLAEQKRHEVIMRGNLRPPQKE